MWDRLPERARAVMRLALAESEQLGHGYVGDEHVLLGLLAEQAGAASSLLRGHGLELASARAELQRLSAAGLMPDPVLANATPTRVSRDPGR
jgi:ATP-dependent Clp protease ATP-binding subunit ClpC